MTETTDDGALSGPLAANIDALMARRQRAADRAAFTERLSARIAAFTGSMWSVALHAAVFGAWILVNTGLLPVMEPWDASLVVLAMIASVESIFLTTFVLMNQNRQARAEDERAELTLQISLLAEHEMTKLARLVLAIARKIEVTLPDDVGIEDLTREIKAEHILDEIAHRRSEREAEGT